MRMLACTLTLMSFLAAVALPARAQEPLEPREEYARARVTAILSQTEDTSMPDLPRRVQQVQLRILSGPDAGRTFTAENGVLPGREDMELREGETVVVRTLIKADGSVEHLLQEKSRLSGLLVLVIGFFLLASLLGGRAGAASVLGLAVSVGILLLFVVPRIVEGWNPLITSLIGSFMIACTSLYLAHGFTRRTTIALASTLTVLSASAALSMVAVRVAKLFGMGTEESLFLQSGVMESIDLRGLLLGGMIIGCLGVLDDITTAQTAAVDEIQKANPRLSFTDLLRAGTSVGREHIASLINTLALAYVGASLPLLLLFWTSGDIPLWVILNSEFLSEEIVRTLVGSTALVLAVPVSTWLAAKAFHGRAGDGVSGHNERTSGTGHLHHHH